MPMKLDVDQEAYDAIKHLEWKERLPFLRESDFTHEELFNIAKEAAYDTLTTSQLRNLVMVLCYRLARAENFIKRR